MKHFETLRPIFQLISFHGVRRILGRPSLKLYSPLPVRSNYCATTERAFCLSTTYGASIELNSTVFLMGTHLVACSMKRPMLIVLLSGMVSSYVIQSAVEPPSFDLEAGLDASSISLRANTTPAASDVRSPVADEYRQTNSQDVRLHRRTWISESCTESEQRILVEVLREVARWSRLARRASSRYRSEAFDYAKLVYYFSWRTQASQHALPLSHTLEDHRREIVFQHYDRVEQQTTNVAGRALVQCNSIPVLCDQSPLPTMYTNVYTNTISIVRHSSHRFGL